jgi:hypothetical protein
LKSALSSGSRAYVFLRRCVIRDYGKYKERKLCTRSIIVVIREVHRKEMHARATTGRRIYSYIYVSAYTARFARSRVENYRMFSHVKRNTRNFFFTPAKKSGRRRKRERERERRENHRNASWVLLFHPRAPPTLARAIYGLSRYRRNIRTLTTLYIYNGAGCFIGRSIAQRERTRRSRGLARAEPVEERVRGHHQLYG